MEIQRRRGEKREPSEGRGRGERERGKAAREGMRGEEREGRSKGGEDGEVI